MLRDVWHLLVVANRAAEAGGGPKPDVDVALLQKQSAKRADIRKLRKL